MSDSAVKLWPHYEHVTGDMLFAPAFPYQTMPTYVSLDEIADFASAPTITTALPSSGGTVFMTGKALFVDTGPLAALTIRLPIAAANDTADICFAAPVTALTLQNNAGAAIAGAPTSAYGPGAAIQLRYISDARGWAYWK